MAQISQKSNTLKLVYSSYFISSIGNFSARLALATIVYTLTGNNTSLAASFMITRLPTLLFGNALGKLADILNKKAMLILADSFGFFIFIFMAISYKRMGAAWCAVLFFLSYSSCALFDFAKAKLITNNCEKKADLGRAMATLQQLTYAALAVGPFLAGYIDEFFGMAWVLLFNSITFLVSILIIINIHDAEEPNKKQNLNINYGWVKIISPRSHFNIIRENPILFRFSEFFFARSIVYGICNALIPVLVFSKLRLGSSALGGYFLTSCLGAVIGTLLYKKYFNTIFLSTSVPQLPILLICGAESIFLAMCFFSNSFSALLLTGFLYAIPMLIVESYIDYVFVHQAPVNAKSGISGFQQAIKSFGYAIGVLISLFLSNSIGTLIVPALMLLGTVASALVIQGRWVEPVGSS